MGAMTPDDQITHVDATGTGVQDTATATLALARKTSAGLLVAT